MPALVSLVAVDIPPGPPPKKGCSVAGDASPIAALALALVIGLALRRRR